MILLACYDLSGSRLKPCLATSWSFSSVFQLILLLKSLKKILLVWLHFSIRLISAFNYFYYVLFSFLSQVQTPQKFAFAVAILYTAKITETSYFKCLPPSIVMSQNTFKALQFFSELIQYSPSPFESPASKMCLRDRAGWREDQPSSAANLNMFHFLVSWFRVNCQIISLWWIVGLFFYSFGPSWSRMAILSQQGNLDMEDVRYLRPLTHAVKF